MKTFLFFYLAFVSVGFAQNFHEDSIKITTPGGALWGTLAVPSTKDKSHLVVFIAGSGPTDRNGNNTMGIKAQPYKLLAEELAKQGIASFRYDKRGVGRSAKVKSETELSFETYIDDAVKWIDTLRKDKRFDKIIIAGHSEGSLIGMIAAQKIPVSGFISIAGAGRSAPVVLKEQLEPTIDSLRKEAYTIIDNLVAGKTVAKVSSSLTTLFRPSVQPYMISWFKYDPTVEIAKLKTPTLIVQGTNDLQIPISDGQRLAKAIPSAQYVEIEGMNHVLKKPESPAKNFDSYTKADLPLAPNLVKTITTFIKEIK